MLQARGADPRLYNPDRDLIWAMPRLLSTALHSMGLVTTDTVRAMMANMDLDHIPNPVAAPTNDMHRFPDITSRHGKAGVGYVLFLHDSNGDGEPDINYIRGRTTRGTYLCDENGVVSQSSTGY